MDNKQNDVTTLLILALRISSLILFYFIVINAFELYHAIINQYNSMARLTLNTAMLCVFALVTWFWPQALSRWLLSGTRPEFNETALNKTMLQNFIILLGLGIFVFALIELANWIMYVAYLKTQPNQLSDKLLNVGLFNIGFRMVIGLLLMTKSHWLTELLNKINAPKTNPHFHD